MEIAALTAFLAPFLPYLVKAGETVADKAATALGEEAWQFAKKIWAKLHPAVEAKAAAGEAVQDLVDRPDDQRARAALELQLEKLLLDDQQLAAELGRLWEQAKAANVVIASGERSIAIGGNATGVFITGDQGRP